MQLMELFQLSPRVMERFQRSNFETLCFRTLVVTATTTKRSRGACCFCSKAEWLCNGDGLRAVRRQILERYVGDGMTDHQLALFLLNDIIRYYRTMAVDYEFKTAEGASPKPWGIRNIKLVFSRKFLYASGLFSVAVTV